MKINVNKHAKKNILVGLLNKTILLFLPFFTKSIINIYLGSIYLGINSLFSSILSVLSLTELGISSALIFHMYQPIAEDDTEAICALLSFYRKAYLAIGVVTSIVGVAIAPFVPLLIGGEYPEDINLYIVYFLQLFSNLIGYFLFGYKQSLLVAYQRDDIYSIINLVTQGGMQITQLLLIAITRNYYLYAICVPVFTIVNNLWIGWITNKMFPRLKCRGTINRSMVPNIKKLIAGSFIQKACQVTRNSLDSVCISAFVGLVVTGIYNNYYTVFNGITLMLGIITSSLVGGIGNHVVLKSKEENFIELKKIDFLYLQISGWCTCCLLCLSQPFMRLWMGDSMLLSDSSVLFMCIYFYSLKLGDVRGIYYTTTGMWWEMRYRSIFETIGNLLLNIVLGYCFGINGIILATVFSLFIFNFFWGSSIVFKNYFGIDKLKSYFVYQLKYAFITVVICCLTWCITSFVSIHSAFLELIVKGIVCCVVPTFLYAVIYYRTDIFKESIKMIKK